MKGFRPYKLLPGRMARRRSNRNYYATKIQRAFRRSRKRFTRYGRGNPSKRTGFLPVKQKTLEKSFVIPSGTYPNGYPIQFAFNIKNLQNLNAFVRLFDQYRICGVSIKMFPQTNTDDTTNQALTLGTSIDLDGGALTTWNELIQCSNTKIANWSSAGGSVAHRSIYLAPRYRSVHVVDPTTAPVTFGYNMGSKKRWLDLADQGETDHYGLNCVFLPPLDTLGNRNLNQNMSVTVVETYYVQFRKLR